MSDFNNYAVTIDSGAALRTLNVWARNASAARTIAKDTFMRYSNLRRICNFWPVTAELRCVSCVQLPKEKQNG